MRNLKTLRVAALAAPLALAAALAAPTSVSAADSIGLYWKAAPTNTAWVNSVGECWQGLDGEKLPPCEAAAPVHAPVVLHLQFELNKYGLNDILNPQELRKVDDLIAEFKQIPGNHEIAIIGHTDKLGSLQHNLVLSENRALTIKNYMIDRGFPAADIREVKGVAWEGQDEANADLGPLENNPLRRRVTIVELGANQM